VRQARGLSRAGSTLAKMLTQRGDASKATWGRGYAWRGAEHIGVVWRYSANERWYIARSVQRVCSRVGYRAECGGVVDDPSASGAANSRGDGARHAPAGEGTDEGEEMRWELSHGGRVAPLLTS
jgi:hypothetical protein